jgi:hypothetical protein
VPLAVRSNCASSGQQRPDQVPSLCDRRALALSGARACRQRRCPAVRRTHAVAAPSAPQRAGRTSRQPALRRCSARAPLAPAMVRAPEAAAVQPSLPPQQAPALWPATPDSASNKCAGTTGSATLRVPWSRLARRARNRKPLGEHRFTVGRSTVNVRFTPVALGQQYTGAKRPFDSGHSASSFTTAPHPNRVHRQRARNFPAERFATHNGT